MDKLEPIANVDAIYFSSNSEFMALIIDKTTLQISDSNNKVLTKVKITSSIFHFEFNQNNTLYLYCTNNVVKARSLKDVIVFLFIFIIFQAWECTIAENSLGLSHARFLSPTLILTSSPYSLICTIYSLIKEKSFIIRNPKHVNKGVALSENMMFMAEHN